MIGLVIGAAADAPTVDNTLSTDEVLTIAKGDTCRIFLWNDGEVVGAFSGIERLSNEQYQHRYYFTLKNLVPTVYLPSLGDTVVLQFTTQKKLRGVVLGFDKQHLEFQEIGRADSGKISCDSLAQIVGNNGRHIEGDSLHALISKGQIPLLSAIRVSNEKGERQIPLDKISSIVVKAKKTRYWLIGLAGGAMIDVAVVLVLIASFDLDLDLSGMNFGLGR
ncbi:MAG: hypothetical protein HGB11_13140 [Chlorobiales bacterium]|nr:hypothetical protein [Chlorobiales bacterium]